MEILPLRAQSLNCKEFIIKELFFFKGFPSGDGRRISGDGMALQQQQAPVNIFTPSFTQPGSPSAITNNPGDRLKNHTYIDSLKSSTMQSSGVPVGSKMMAKFWHMIWDSYCLMSLHQELMS